MTFYHGLGWDRFGNIFEVKNSRRRDRRFEAQGPEEAQQLATDEAVAQGRDIRRVLVVPQHRWHLFPKEHREPYA
jgi:hypothetical protein